MSHIALNLVVIRSSDMDRALQFYSALGLAFSQEQHGAGPEHYACHLGDTVFEIYPRQADAESSTATRLGFRVPSVDATVAHLRQLGATVISAPKKRGDCFVAVVCDADGHRVELSDGGP